MPMMYKRRRTTSSRKAVVARRSSRRTPIYKSVRNVWPVVHRFRRQHQLGDIFGTTTSGQQVGFGLTFQVSDVVNASEFTALYDQFKLTGVKLRMWIMRDNSASASTAGPAQIAAFKIPLMYYVIDHDTSTDPSTDELRQYSNCKMWQFNNTRPFSIFIKPKMLTEVYRTNITRSTVPTTPRFISTDQIDTQHFGFRARLINMDDSSITLRRELTYYFSCKNPK